MRRLGVAPETKAIIGYAAAVAAMLATGPIVLVGDAFGIVWGLFAVCGVLSANLVLATTLGLRPYFARRPSSVMLEPGPSDVPEQRLLRVNRAATTVADVKDVVLRTLRVPVQDAKTTYGVYLVLPGRVVELDTVAAYHEALELAMALRQALGLEPRPAPSKPMEVIPAAGCATVLLGVAEVLVAIGLLIFGLDMHPTSLWTATLPALTIVTLDLVVHGLLRLALGRAARSWVASRFPDAFGGAPTHPWNAIGWALMTLTVSAAWVVLTLLSVGVAVFG